MSLLDDEGDEGLSPSTRLKNTVNGLIFVILNGYNQYIIDLIVFIFQGVLS